LSAYSSFPEASRGREWLERGAEVVQVDFRDTTGLTAALAGAEAAWLLVPPDVGGAGFLPDRVSLSASLAQAVRESGLPRTVVLSSIGAHRSAGTGPILGSHGMEQALAGHPGVTFLRVAWFVENWLPALEIVRTEGVLPVCQDPCRPHPMGAMTIALERETRTRCRGDPRGSW
jgi:uncharacterized protein YbjT (DUF2867 family)